MTGAESAFVPWLTVGILMCAVLLMLHRPLGFLLKLLVRSSIALLLLSGLHLLWDGLGVNWFNALVLGGLGVPGFALLLILRWLLRI